MKVSVFISVFLLNFVLLSCGGPDGSQTYGPGNRNIPYPAPSSNPEPVAPQPVPIMTNAQIRVGSVDRYFSSQNESACLLDRLRGEAVVIFSDESSGSSLSIRMARLDPSKTSYEFSRNGTESNLLIALGGEIRRNVFKFDPAANSSCTVTYSFSQSHFNGEFTCQGLLNRERNIASATGRWVCKLQTNEDWNW